MTSFTQVSTLATRINHFFQHRTEHERITPADHHPIVGPPGTVCFVGTTQCFHFGSRVEHGVAPRLVTMIQYLTPSSFMLPRDHRAGSPYRHLATAGIPHVQRLVLGDL